MDIAAQGDEIRLPDGRVTLAHPGRDLDPRYTNGDLAPVPIERRTWTTYNYAALWIGMSHNIPSYLLASGLIAVGFNWVQAIILIVSLLLYATLSTLSPRRQLAKAPAPC
jgi:nucleobase:cation symporter-1, NCS1 family